MSEALLTLAAGAALVGTAIWRRSAVGALLAGAGGYLIYCGITDSRRPYQGAVRVGVTIDKDPNRVYDFVSDPQNWNKFLHVLQLESRGLGRLRLAIGKPAGIDIESRVTITDHKPGEYIAWASDQQILEHRGVIPIRQSSRRSWHRTQSCARIQSAHRPHRPGPCFPRWLGP
jgi:uncharacterized membrane protein